MFTDFTEELNSNFVQQIQNLNQFKSLDFYYIIEAYGNVMGGYQNFYDAWIYENNESWCVGFWIDGNYLLNSKELDVNDLHKINEKINFKFFDQDGFHFAGDTKLIDNLTELNKGKFELDSFKERYFYVSNKINFESELQNNISLLNICDIDKVATLYQQYYVEEYEGKNNKELEFVKANINYLMSKKLIYKLELENDIIGFCTKMSFLSQKPNMIGTIFIEESKRNNKFAQNLLAEVSNEMLRQNQEIYLMTTKKNTASNKMVENVGFIKQYDHSDRIIKNYA